MRTISADKQAILYSAGRSERLRVEVKDATSTWRDLSTYVPGFDPVLSATWRENNDDPHTTGEVSLRREQFKHSLSPFQAASAVNVAFNPASAYAPLIALNREFRISVNVSAMDSTSSVWEVFFHGRIDKFNLADTDNIRLEGRDLGGKLAVTYIEEERVYGLAAVAGNPVSCRLWAPSLVYTLNQYVVPTESKRNVAGTARFYKVTTAGTGGLTEPVWPTAGTVADGSAVLTLQGATSPDVGFPVEKVIQNNLDDWSPGVTLYVPSALTFNVTQYLQSRVGVLEAIRALALLFGGEVRYKWRAGTAQFELTIYDPDRTKTSIDYQFSDADYEDITNLTSEISGVRNVWQGVYSDAGDKDPTGRPKRKTIVLTDSTSINKYGRLFAEIAEDEASQIDSSAEMTTMLTAALSDTKEPKIEQEIALVHGFPWVELNDLMRFSANRYYSTSQDLAVVSHEHTAAEGFIKTTIQCRGQPSAGFDRWHVITTSNADEGGKQLNVFESAGGITFIVASIPNGGRLQVTSAPGTRALGEEYEFHVSTSASFTPSSATLVQKGAQRMCDVTTLVPGTTYYAQVVPFVHDGSSVVRGYSSVEVTFVAGYLLTRAMQPLVNINTLPVNCDFEASADLLLPPDKWTFSGTWGTHAELRSDAWMSGGKSVRFNNNATSSHVLASELIPIRRDLVTPTRLRVRFWLFQSAGTTAATPYMVCRINYYDNTFASLTTVAQIFPSATASAWIACETIIDVSSIPLLTTLSYFGIELYRDVSGGAGTQTFNVDRVEVQDISQTYGWFWNSPTLAAGWTQFAARQTIQYRKVNVDGLTLVMGEGLVQNTSGGNKTAPSTMYTLPAAYRPPVLAFVPGVCLGAAVSLCTIVINTNGNIDYDNGPVIPNNGWVNAVYSCWIKG